MRSFYISFAERAVSVENYTQSIYYLFKARIYFAPNQITRARTGKFFNYTSRNL